MDNMHSLIDAVFDEMEALRKERDLLRDKWRQMEAYGFDSPSAVFARIAALEAAGASYVISSLLAVRSAAEAWVQAVYDEADANEAYDRRKEAKP